MQDWKLRVLNKAMNATLDISINIICIPSPIVANITPYLGREPFSQPHMSINTEPFQRTDISTQSLGPAFQLHRVYFLKVFLPDSPGPANYRVLMSHTIKRNNRQMRIAMLPPGFLALLWPCLCGGLLCFGFSASASYLEHLGTADRACS